MKKIFVSHGDIILDNIYNGDLQLIKQDGGGSNWNTLYNLSYLGETCYAIGNCGKDEEGNIALTSLTRHGINIDYIKFEDTPTSIMNIIIPNTSTLGDNSIIHSWYSPITNKRTLSFSENLPTRLPSFLEKEQIYVILDKFETVNFEFLKNVPIKKVCLDIGHIRFIEHFSKQYLSSFFSLANLVQLNDNVAPLLYERLQIQNAYELFDLLNLELLVVTQGKKGATFFYRENGTIVSVEKSPEIIAQVIDSSGAGDAFFATIIKEYAYTNQIDTFFISSLFEKANLASREVICTLGSRRN